MTQLAPAVENRLYTLDEFEGLDLPSDGSKYELIDGAIVVSPPAGDEHGRIINDLSYELNVYIRPRKLGRVWQTSRFKVGRGFGPAPDVAFVTTKRLPKTSKGAVEVVPDLVVEVWSPGDLATHKQQEEARRKIRRYQTAGVRLVWAINPAARKVEVYHLDQPDPVEVLDENAILSGEDLLPGFTLPVKTLFPLSQ
jgi:Uma2 family endonuclease